MYLVESFLVLPSPIQFCLELLYIIDTKSHQFNISSNGTRKGHKIIFKSSKNEQNINTID